MELGRGRIAFLLSRTRGVGEERREWSVMKNGVVFALGYYSGFYPVMFGSGSDSSFGLRLGHVITLFS